MKKMILTAFAALLFAAPAVHAQKVNKAGLLAKIEKSDADITDPKKNEKASTWISRGKAFYDAAYEPTKDIFVSMPTMTLKLALGEPTSTSETKLGDVACTEMIYPYFKLYVKDDKVLAWKQTQEVYPGAAMKAIQAYNKAYELDPKSADKVKEGLKAISDFCSQAGNVGLDTGDNVGAADAYATAYTAQSSPAYGTADPALLYYAGYLRTVDGANNPESFVLGATYLQKAIDLGYVDEKGDVYYYLFHSYYGQKDKNADALMKAKDALLAGIAKFPKNERILDGLMQLYTSPDDKVGDPADLVKLINDAIDANPQNVDLWFGRGRIFFAMNDYDESIASFHKVVELKPDMFEGNHYLGLFYILKGDAMNTALNEKPYSSQAVYDNDLKVINDVYRQAIPWLEKAHALKADDLRTVELLKQLCYRFRDDEGMTEKFNKYDELFKKLQGQ